MNKAVHRFRRLFAAALLVLAVIGFCLVRQRLRPMRARGEAARFRSETETPSLLSTAPEPPQRPEVLFLADSVEEAEQRLNHVDIRWRQKVRFPGNVTVNEYLWAVQNGKTRAVEWLSASPLQLTQTVSDGRQAQRLSLLAEGKGKPPRPVNTVVGASDTFSELHAFESWTCMRFGDSPLSEYLRRSALSAEQIHGQWKVRLQPQNPDVAREELWLRPDRDFRVASHATFRVDGSCRSRETVTRWIGGGDVVWLPATVECLFPVTPPLPVTVEITHAKIDHSLPNSLFILPDDGKTPIFDRRSRRFVRSPAATPVSERALSASLSVLEKPNTPPSAPTDNRVMHNNGSTADGYCGLQCVWVVAHLLGKSARWSTLLAAYTRPRGEHSMAELQDAARLAGVEMEGLQVPAENIHQVRLPCILFVGDGHDGHYYTIAKLVGDTAYLFAPPSRILRIPVAELTLPRYWQQGNILAPIDRRGTVN